jgi:hypothetical protein
VPLPLPADPAVIDNQLALSAAAQPQPSAVRTSNVPVPPDAGTEAEDDASVIVQPCPWFTVKVRPAIVSVPDRAGPVVDATVKLTVPSPLPFAPEVTVIHDALLFAVQVQPAPELTVVEPLPPPAGTDWLSGDTVKVQPFPWETVTDWPATTSVPERAGPLSAAAENVTVPEPLPLPPAVIVSHGCVLEALHSQPAVVVTLTVRVPPLASTVCESGETSNAHPGDWVTVKDCPAIVSDAVRDGPAVGATLTVMLPGPVPAAGVVVTQLALLEAVHGHPGPAETVTTCEPPPAPVA